MRPAPTCELKSPVVLRNFVRTHVYPGSPTHSSPWFEKFVGTTRREREEALSSLRAEAVIRNLFDVRWRATRNGSHNEEGLGTAGDLAGQQSVRHLVR